MVSMASMAGAESCEHGAKSMGAALQDLSCHAAGPTGAALTARPTHRELSSTSRKGRAVMTRGLARVSPVSGLESTTLTVCIAPLKLPSRLLRQGLGMDSS